MTAVNADPRPAPAPPPPSPPAPPPPLPASLDAVAAFPILRQMDFFNHAGVAPISGAAADALLKYAQQARDHAYIGSGWYKRASQVKAAAARLIGARGPHEIAFIPNTSTGLSTIAKGLDWRQGDDVVITNVEYPANRYPWQDLKRLGVNLIEVQQQPDGRIDSEDVIDAITSSTRVVALSHVQYASGHRLQDVKSISDTVHAAGGYLCLDAIQSVGVMPVDVQAMGVDFLSADGHKWMLGPEGCGFMYAHEELIPLLHPNVVGWMNMVDASNYGNYRFEFQEDARRFEPGSYNIPGILALGASLDLLLDVGMDLVWRRIDALTTRLCNALASKGYHVISPRRPSERSGIVIFEPPPASVRETPPLTQIVSDLQDQHNIIIVIREGRLRCSPHFYNDASQIDRLIDALP